MPHNVVVTGGASGIGRIIAQRFVANGDRVYIWDNNRDAVEIMLAANPTVRGSVADVASPSDVAQAFAEATAWMDRVDVLINDAAIPGPRAPIEELSDADWDRTIRINLYGMFHCIRQVLPGMKERRHGTIVNISTGSVRTLPVNRSVYNVSKWAVEGLTRTTAREAGPHGVRVNAIRPGMVNTPSMRRIVQRIADQTGRTGDEVEASFLKFIAMRTKVEPDDIAGMAVFLASDDAARVTAQIIEVDGMIEWEE